jgi:hypothetical protein
MGAASRPAGYYHIPFGYLILYGEADVGASSAEPRRVLFDPLTPVYLSDKARVVEDVVGGEKFVYTPHVSSAKNLVEPPPDQGLVLFDHRLFSFALPPISRSPACGV